MKNSRAIRYSYNTYRASPGAVKAALVVLYGLKCYLSLSRRLDGRQSLVYLASYPNERRVLNHVRTHLEKIPSGEITISLKNCLRLSSMVASVRFLRSVPRLYRFAMRVVRKHEFMPACRIFSTVTYYQRCQRLLDEHVQAVFIACQYSPECLGLAVAAHRSGKKVLFTNHATATGETGYVAPVHADLVAATSQAIADLYQRNTPHPLHIVRYTVTEPQRPLRLPADEVDSLTIGVYLTALTEMDRLQMLIAGWLRLEAVRSVIVRTHPARIVNPDLSAVESMDARIKISTDRPLREDVERTDIAVCGASTVAVEILRGGCPVLYERGLDRSQFDYNGYLKAGLIACHPEQVDNSIFTVLDRHYTATKWPNIMRYYDYGYGENEEEITGQFVAAVSAMIGSDSEK